MRHKPLLFAVGALTLAACSSNPDMDEQMQQDLQAASASTFELAPTTKGQKVVSAIEQIPQAHPKPQATNQPAPRKKAPRPENRVAEQPSTEPAATAPRTLPASSVSPPPPGGYKGLGDVIRNAPFPIKP
jgi:hypothetical protein